MRPSTASTWRCGGWRWWRPCRRWRGWRTPSRQSSGWTWSSTGASSPATSGQGRSGLTGRRASSRARRAGVRTPAEAAKRCTGATTINGGQLDGHTIITCKGSNFIGVFHLNLIRIDYFNPLKPFPLCSH